MYKALFFIVGIIILSPIFGIILAHKTGYHEPLDLVIEKLQIPERPILEIPSLFKDYSVPRLNPIIGYILSGLTGVVIILFIGLVFGKLISKKEADRC